MFETGYQPSPTDAARRIAGALSPPTQIGGCGFETGFGSNTTCWNLTCAPSIAGFSSVHSDFQAWIYSSVTAPRASNGGVSSASNSSRIQPDPMPAITRPPESTSAVVNSFAVSTAGRYGTTSTDVSSFSVRVKPARKVSVPIASKHSPVGAPGHTPSAV